MTNKKPVWIDTDTGVDDAGTIKVTPYSSGVISLPAGTKGAIIHLRNSAGNPLYGSADRVRRETAINIGKMIRDGYSATYIVGKALEEVAVDSGEKYGGGGVGCTGSNIFDVRGDKQLVKAEKKDSGMKNKKNKVIYNYELKSFKHSNDDGSSHLFDMDTFKFDDDNAGANKVAEASISKFRDFTLSQEIYKIDSGACSGIPSKQSYTNKTNEERNKKIMAWKMKKKQ